jgi:CheY-like chemotaxis protein
VRPLTKEDALSEQPLVLIVDDQPDNLYMYSHYLENEGRLRVITAMNGREAVLKAKRLQPEVILLDVAMPQMDGYEVARELRDDPNTKAIPIVLVSAHATEAQAAKALGKRYSSFVGTVAHGYVSKPCQPDVLLEHVRHVLAS